MTSNEGLTYRIKRVGWFYPVLLFAVTVMTRVPFRSKFLYHLDSVHYALGLEKYDVYLHQPHPPGYFLYVMAGRALNVFVQDPNASFIWISVVASGLAVVALYYLGSAIFDPTVGISAALLALTSPLFWFYGEVALNYVVAAVLNVWMALLCWQLWQKDYNWAYLSPVLLGCVAGIRQDFFIFLFPFWLGCVLRGVDRKRAAILLTILGVTITSWVIPMLVMTGGLERYLAAVQELWEFHNSAFAIWNAGLESRIVVALTLVGSMAYGIGIGAVFILFSVYALIRSGSWRRISRNKALFFGLWLVPALLFQAFIVLHPHIHHYGLFFLPALMLLLPASIKFSLAEINRVAGGRSLTSRINPSVVLWLIIALNAVSFCVSDMAYSAHTIQRHGRTLEILLSGIKGSFPSKSTVVVDPRSSYFYSYRHIQYYLPEFRVYLADRRANDRGQKWHFFGAVDGQTRLFKAIRIPESTRRIVYLVDPRDEAYTVELKAEGMQRLLLPDQHVLWYQQVKMGER